MSNAPYRNLAAASLSLFRNHLIQRMHDRSISIEDLNQLRLWLESKPIVPEGRWYKNFASFKLCGEGSYPKTFLLPDQLATGQEL